MSGYVLPRHPTERLHAGGSASILRASRRYNILTRDYVRKSRDEELVADLVAYMAAAGEKPASSSDILDEFFGLAEGGEENPRFQQIEAAIQRVSPEVLEQQFLAVHDTIRDILQCAGKKFNVLMFDDAGLRVPSVALPGW